MIDSFEEQESGLFSLKTNQNDRAHNYCLRLKDQTGRFHLRLLCNFEVSLKIPTN